MIELNGLSTYLVFNLMNDGLSILSFICSFLFMVVIFCFLHNSPPERQCFLLYLHKDFVAISLSLYSMWFLKVIFTDDEEGMGEYAAMFLSFCLISLTQTLLILINLISAFKLYIVRTKLLDPPMPWDTDETFGLTCTRSIVGLLVIGYQVTLFGLGFYPRIYYLFAKQDVALSNTSLISWLYLGPYAALIILYLITSLGSRISKGMENEAIDSIVPKQIKYFSWVAVGALALVICIVLSARYVVSLKLEWKIIQLMTSITQFIFPAAIVINVDQLRSYSITFFKRRRDDMFLLNIFIVPTGLCTLMYVSLCIVYKIVGM